MCFMDTFNMFRYMLQKYNRILCFFSTNKLHFTPEFLGRVKLVTSVASLLGVGLYNGFLKNVPLRKIFFVTTIFGSVMGMTQVSDMSYSLKAMNILIFELTLLN